MSSDIEKLIVAQAVYKIVSEEVSTKDPDNLRGRVDAHYREKFEQDGGKSYDLNLFGKKVGTYSVSVTKPKKQRVLNVVDPVAFMAWCEDNDCIITEPDIAKANRHFDYTGELPAGCSMVTVEDDGGKFKHGTLRINAASVNDALGGTLLPALLTEGGGQ